MERDSFVFYGSFIDAINELPNESQLKIIKIICDFALKGIEPTGLKGVEKAVFLLIKPVILSNNKRYVDGQKGGRPKNNSKINKKNHRLLNSKTNGYETTKPNVDVDVDEDVDVNVDVDENVNENGNGAEKGKEETTKTANDFSFNSPKGKTTKTANGKQQTANDIPKGYKELVEYLTENYDCPEKKAKLIANRVQSDKVDLSLAHCEEFTAMTEEQIIGYFEAMKKLKQLRGRSKMVNAANVFNRA